VDPGDRVNLSFAGFSAAIAVRLNGRPLGVLPVDALPGGFDVTGELAARNELELEILTPAAGTLQSDAPPGEVALEIRAETK
jgi:hypothetical protein